MKKLRKLSIIVAMLMLSIIMVACSKPKTTPEEGTKILLDMLFKDDKSNIDKIGVSDAEYQEFRTELEKGFAEGFTETTNSGYTISDDAMNKFREDIFTGLSKMEYEVTTISTEKETAKVEVKIKGFDLNKIITDSTATVTAAAFADLSMSEDEIMKLTLKVVGEGFANGTFLETPKSVTLNLTLEDNMWVPQENDIYALMGAAMNM